MGFVQAWPKEREEQLRGLYAQVNEFGYYLSHGYIAMIMDLPRSAVMGKIKRLHLTRDPERCYVTPAGTIIDPKVTSFKPRNTRDSSRESTVVHIERYNKQVLRKAKPPAHVADSPGDFKGVYSAFACQVVGLTENTCHFPIGHVGKEGFHFCGAPISRGSYCADHNYVCLRRA